MALRYSSAGGDEIVRRGADPKVLNNGKKKNRTNFERAKTYEDVDQFA